MALDGGIPADRLREFIERIESLEQRHAVIAAEIAAAVGEAAAAGFDGPNPQTPPPPACKIMRLKQG